MKKLMLTALAGLLASSSAIAGLEKTVIKTWVESNDATTHVAFTVDSFTEVILYAGVDNIDSDAAQDPILTLYDENTNALARESSWIYSINPDQVTEYAGFELDTNSAATVVGLEPGRYNLVIENQGASGFVSILVDDAINGPFQEPVSNLTDNQPMPQPTAEDGEVCYTTIPGLFGLPDSTIRVDCNDQRVERPIPESTYVGGDGLCYRDIPGLFGLPDSTIRVSCGGDNESPSVSNLSPQLPSGPEYSTNPDDVSGDDVCAFYSTGGGSAVYGPCDQTR